MNEHPTHEGGSGHWGRLMRIVERFARQQFCEHDWERLTLVAGSGPTEYRCRTCEKHESVGIDPGAWA